MLRSRERVSWRGRSRRQFKRYPQEGEIGILPEYMGLFLHFLLKVC
jgi:hypothetical protein